jgi:thioredoxin 1
VKKNIWKIIALFVLVVLISSVYIRNQFLNHAQKDNGALIDQELVTEIDKKIQYIRPGTTGRVMVMDLGSTGCVPCRMMMPILYELSKEYNGKVDIQFIDVNEKKIVAEKYRIYGIPTQIFFNEKGKEVYRHVGFFPKDEIIKKLKEMGVQ